MFQLWKIRTSTSSLQKLSKQTRSQTKKNRNRKINKVIEEKEESDESNTETEQSETHSEENLTGTKPPDKTRVQIIHEKPNCFQIRRLSEKNKPEKTFSLNRIQDWTKLEDDLKTIELDLTIKERKVAGILDTGSPISIIPAPILGTLAHTDFILQRKITEDNL